jgi:hypothetical protein
MLPMIAAAIAVWLATGPATAQGVERSSAVTEVRAAIAAARKDVDAYKAAGGTTTAADQPAIKWDAAFWAYRDRYPNSEASALATAEAVRLLLRAELKERALARVASVDVDDPSWEKLSSAIYEDGAARKDLGYTLATLTRVSQSSSRATNKAATLIVLGRAYRRQGDKDAANGALEQAKAAAPGSPYATEAEGLLYEIKYLSVGVAAPPIKAKARNGRAIDLAALRGKPVVLVFWGTT